MINQFVGHVDQFEDGWIRSYYIMKNLEASGITGTPKRRRIFRWPLSIDPIINEAAKAAKRGIGHQSASWPFDSGKYFGTCRLGKVHTRIENSKCIPVTFKPILIGKNKKKAFNWKLVNVDCSVIHICKIWIWALSWMIQSLLIVGKVLFYKLHILSSIWFW